VSLADDVGVPVILMSGHPDMMDRVPGVERPCIQKPFSLTALLATIESVVPVESVVPADDVGNPR
jgi:DNA-binding response OmpR family regulator